MGDLGRDAPGAQVAPAVAGLGSPVVPNGSATIEVTDLTKSFGDLEAVRGVSFSVAAGETFGFLGPNGAGKSTTISMLCTLLHPTSGVAKVAGYDVASHQADVRKHLELAPQGPFFAGLSRFALLGVGISR